MSDPSREDYIRATKQFVADAWQGVENLKRIFLDAGFDHGERLKAESFRARAIDQCEMILESARLSNEENCLRELPKVIAEMRAICVD
jgi:hypothetical protein